MSIAILFNQKDPLVWMNQLKEKLPEEKIEIYPAIENKDEVEVLLTWKPHQGYVNEFKNLKVVQSVGAGIDHLLHTPIPESIKVTRIVDPALKQDMFEHVLMCIMASMKNTMLYYKDQLNRSWLPKSYESIHSTTITILGMGEIGKFVAVQLKNLGFQVQGWSNSPKKIDGILTFAGRDALFDSVRTGDFIVNILPLTEETKELLSHTLFQQIANQPVLINVGRGGHMKDEDLVTALDNGFLKAAYLDVFHQEPLEIDHPFWTHPNIYITPHIASITNPDTAIDLVIENYKRFKSNNELQHVVDLKRGY